MASHRDWRVIRFIDLDGNVVHIDVTDKLSETLFELLRTDTSPFIEDYIDHIESVQSNSAAEARKLAQQLVNFYQIPDLSFSSNAPALDEASIKNLKWEIISGYGIETIEFKDNKPPYTVRQELAASRALRVNSLLRGFKELRDFVSQATPQDIIDANIIEDCKATIRLLTILTDDKLEIIRLKILQILDLRIRRRIKLGQSITPHERLDIYAVCNNIDTIDFEGLKRALVRCRETFHYTRADIALLADIDQTSIRRYETKTSWLTPCMYAYLKTVNLSPEDTLALYARLNPTPSSRCRTEMEPVIEDCKLRMQSEIE